MFCFQVRTPCERKVKILHAKILSTRGPVVGTHKPVSAECLEVLLDPEDGSRPYFVSALVGSDTAETLIDSLLSAFGLDKTEENVCQVFIYNVLADLPVISIHRTFNEYSTKVSFREAA